MEKQSNLFFWRAVAYLIDLAVVASLAVACQLSIVILYSILAKTSPTQSLEAQKAFAQINHIVVYLTYFTLTHWFSGQTVGKRICGLKLLFREEEIGLARSACRSLAYIASGQLTFGIGFLLAFFRSDQKALHDLFCGTRVEFSQRAEVKEIPKSDPVEFKESA